MHYVFIFRQTAQRFLKSFAYFALVRDKKWPVKQNNILIGKARGVGNDNTSLFVEQWVLSVYKSSEFFHTRQNHEFLTYKEVSPWLLFIVTNNRDEIRKQLLLLHSSRHTSESNLLYMYKELLLTNRIWEIKLLTIWHHGCAIFIYSLWRITNSHARI